MKGLVKEAGLPSTRFEIGDFFTIIFPRKPSSEEQFVSEVLLSDRKDVKRNYGRKFAKKFDITEKSAFNILKILDFIEINSGYIYQNRRTIFITKNILTPCIL